ncbi:MULTISPECIES: nitroreductase family protein [Vibrio]|jgi:nitroreductase|uniref:nitroreductase family protein n=1 Tax=Vibrio TaxID=662 RepID=UPI000BFF97E7|nr:MULTISPECIES: nitroreductase family protein [unclassified Vibrio]PHJ43540.1 nitroreductase [Vibrio sp. PID17_43]RIZ55063.1 nitroreductase [Vibrio sp. PID23_8]
MSFSSFESIVHTRRSVRKYDANAEFNHDDVAAALELATLSPNSSNMQMWEFHRVISPEKRTKLAKYCMGQNAATTANELVVFVVTTHNWEERAQRNAEIVRQAFTGRNDAAAKRALKYYEKLIPMVYNNDRLGLRGVVRKIYSWWLGRAKPMVREVSKTDVRVCLHKSVSLAAMTFMYAMRDKGYDTCPMEGFDSKRVKTLLGLRDSDQITMVISCGIRGEEGVYGKRNRVDNETIIKKH